MQIMNRILAKFVIICICLLVAWKPARAGFTGKIHLDSTWQKVAYLSLLPSFEDMYTLNKDFVIAEAILDINGVFSFETDFLPKMFF